MKTQFETRVTKKLSKPINYLFKARNHIFLDYLTIRLERVNPSVNFHLYSYRNIDDHNISLYILWLPGFIYLILVDFSILFFNVKSGFSFVRKMRFWFTNVILYCMGFLTSIWFVLLSLYSQSLGIYQFFIFQRKKKTVFHIIPKEFSQYTSSVLIFHLSIYPTNLFRLIFIRYLRLSSYHDIFIQTPILIQLLISIHC